MPLIRSVNNQTATICSDEEFWEAIKSKQVQKLEALNYTRQQINGTSTQLVRDVPTQFTPLSWCAYTDAKDMLIHLLARGANKEATTEGRMTPLVLAARCGSINVIRALLVSSANINHQTEDDATAVIFATYNKHIESLQALLVHEPDLNKQDKAGYTALMYAVVNNDSKALTLLLDKKADVNRQNHEGCTALMLAVKYGNFKFLKLLIEAGADVSKTDVNGHDALHIAVKHSAELFIIELLYAAHPDFDKKQLANIAASIFRPRLQLILEHFQLAQQLEQNAITKVHLHELSEIECSKLQPILGNNNGLEKLTLSAEELSRTALDHLAHGIAANCSLQSLVLKIKNVEDDYLYVFIRHLFKNNKSLLNIEINHSSTSELYKETVRLCKQLCEQNYQNKEELETWFNQRNSP